MQVLPISKNNSTAFKAMLPKKTDDNIMDFGRHDYWDEFASMCDKEGTTETLKKHLEDLQNVEKGKILAFDVYNWSHNGEMTKDPFFLFGLFDSQEELENIRNAGFNKKINFFNHRPSNSIHISTYRHEDTLICIRENGVKKIVSTGVIRTSINSKFFLDILGKMVEILKKNSEASSLAETAGDLINKFRVK